MRVGVIPSAADRREIKKEELPEKRRKSQNNAEKEKRPPEAPESHKDAQTPRESIRKVTRSEAEISRNGL